MRLLLDYRLIINENGLKHKYLPVKMGHKTQEQFDNEERKREKFLRGECWRIIRIISENDKLPSKSSLKSLITEALAVLDSGRSYYEINFDNLKIRYKGMEKEFNAGKLKRIRNN
jgi:hypothetical protein